MVVPSHSVMRGANEDESCFAALVRILVFGEFSSCQTVRDSYVRESPAGGSKLINCVNKPQSGIHALTHQFNVRKRGASKCTSASSPHPPKKKSSCVFLTHAHVFNKGTMLFPHRCLTGNKPSHNSQERGRHEGKFSLSESYENFEQAEIRCDFSRVDENVSGQSTAIVGTRSSRLSPYLTWVLCPLDLKSIF